LEVAGMIMLDYMNRRVQKLNIFDVKLAQGAAIFFALIIVKIIPEIMTLSVWWFIALLILFVIRPVYAFFIKG
jgi:threonine/homoserine efflux transporter RhtA